MKEMTCLQFEEIVHGLVRLEILDVAARDQAFDHAAECANCAALLADVQTLAEISEADCESALLEETPKSVELALLASFRQEHHQQRVWKRSVQWAAAAALAAGLALAAWGTYPKWAPEFSKLRGSSINSAVSSGSQTGTQISPADSQIADAANGADPLANFVPVPGADNTLDSDDPGMVVHVALTRASLGELGYPVDKAHATEIVQADVLVGEDGWPRAVRLLQ
ncbi:MAG TPA: hypothetical protein VN862_09470 [Candidatus Acidoferrales bacterium]|jgi:hypothetical protein|nr:hypothetical protein [Candidatus Acidoferrales bacterium]